MSPPGVNAIKLKKIMRTQVRYKYVHNANHHGRLHQLARDEVVHHNRHGEGTHHIGVGKGLKNPITIVTHAVEIARKTKAGR